MAVLEASAALESPAEEMRAAEVAEVAAVLESPLFQRAAGISQVLRYLCRMYFEGRSSEVKEYTIAVEALGRKPDFDPQSDAIVRVDLYNLRKRLQKYYASEGREHAVHIQLPAGSYAPEFVHAAALKQQQQRFGAAEKNSSALPELALVRRRWHPWPHLAWLQRARRSSYSLAALFLLAGLALGLLLGGRSWHPLWHKPSVALHAVTLPVPKAPPLNITVFAGWQPPVLVPVSRRRPVRILCGRSSGTFTDTSGNTWLPDQDYTGGEAFFRPVAAIARTLDPQIYFTGRQGAFQYSIPVPAGLYEVHLLFAETKPGVADSMRTVSYTIAGMRQPGQRDPVAVAQALDVVTDAGSPATATEKIYPHIAPGKDGKIHMNFWSQDAFLNAIEILPEKNGAAPPLLLSTQERATMDPDGNRWLPDQYFSGGRNVDHEFSAHRFQDASPILTRERYGNFNYAIPAVQDASYTITLWMAERYWGASNLGLGGVGSRLFDVDCNGIMLLHAFDILQANPKTGVVTVVLRHVPANALGKLNLSFVPEQGDALMNAIEVLREQ